MLNENLFFLQIYEALKNTRSPLLVLANNEQQANKLFLNLKNNLPNYNYSHYPAWDTLAYEQLTTSPSIRAARLETLYNISLNQTNCIISNYSAIMAFCPPKDFIGQNILIIKVGQLLSLRDFCQKLAKFGYKAVDIVMSPGEFAKRGGIVDVFPMAQKQPCRIDWLDETIESIRLFDLTTQKSKTTVESIQTLPAYEYSSDNKNHNGQHFNLHKLHHQTNHFLDYFTKKPMILHQSKNYKDIINSTYNNHKKSYLSYKNMDLSKPELIWDNDLYSKLIATTISNGKSKSYKQNLEKINKKNITIIINPDDMSSSNLNKKLATNTILKISSFIEAQAPGIYYLKSNLIGGAKLNNIVITSEDFTNDDQPKAITKKQAKHHADFNPLEVFNDLSTIKTDDYLVHQDYGICQFKGVTQIAIQHQSTDFLKLEYANQAFIYLPMYNLYLLSKYYQNSTTNIPLSKIGSKKWDTIKQKAKEHIDQLTSQLLSIYTQQANNPGISINIDSQSYQQFAQQFPFEYTPDQLKTIKDIKKDLATNKNMDRLVCGDVGFGKTEVAMHAAFITTNGGYQCLVLAPTTVLSQQHFATFKNRFVNSPVNIACLTRHTTIHDKATIKDQLINNKIDILIGTHAALNQQYQFKNLGLIIIDEEHRFGVKQKELLKNHRSTANILTLSATPIPRTLNMSLSKLRALSIIQTPPEDRLDIITQITYMDSIIVENAIQREIQRGGQVYFCINDIAKLTIIKQQLFEKHPDITITIAHGQMPADAIKKAMQDFKAQICQILVCTTLIESGIDIPSANTIIIYRADLMGLSQLHQLRGRVGRSNLQAYAYLCIPKDYELQANAKSRLEALVNNQKVGSGFNIAMQDLEIRGAGSLLGAKQSGIMQQLGMATYLKLLQNSINAQLNNSQEAITNDLEINTDMPCYIPHEYISSETMRLEFYCEITNCVDYSKLLIIKNNMLDRFGPLPQALLNLFFISQLKIQHQNNSIQSISIKKNSFLFTTNENKQLLRNIFQQIQDPSKLLQFVSPNSFKIARGNDQSNLDLFLKTIEKIYQIKY